MNFIGSILASSDPPGISKPRWHEVIREHPKLNPDEPSEVFNPFTEEWEMPVLPSRHHARTQSGT